MPTAIIIQTPFDARATIMAIPMAVGAPIRGMNEPMNTSTPSGAESGMPRIVRYTNANMPLVSATIMMPRA